MLGEVGIVTQEQPAQIVKPKMEDNGEANETEVMEL